MIMRRRPLLRAAVVGGGAYAAGKRSAERAQMEDEQNERLAGAEQPPPGGQGPAGPAPGAAATPSVLDQLSKLTVLHDQGALTDSEFAAAKAKILGS